MPRASGSQFCAFNARVKNLSPQPVVWWIHDEPSTCRGLRASSGGVPVITPEILGLILADMAGRCGDPPLLLKDSASRTGWREWGMDDTRRLWSLLVGALHQPERESPRAKCYNLKEAAEIAGVSVHTVQGWTRRRLRPLPHIREGRRIIIVARAFEDWLIDESRRNIGGEGASSQ